MLKNTNTWRLAKIYTKLEKTQSNIQNEILPMMAHLGFPDHDLVQKLNDVQEAIQRHFSEFQLKGEQVKK